MPTIDIKDIREFWTAVRFFGSPLEERMAKYWYCLFFPPTTVLIFWGMWFDRFNEAPQSLNVFSIARDPYIETLGASLFLSGLAFKLWEAKVRNTFSTGTDSGIIANDQNSVEAFLEKSRDFKAATGSKFRFLPIAIMVIFAVVANKIQLVFALEAFHNNQKWLALFRVLMVFSFGIFGYAIGAVVWCQVAIARWIASLSTEKILRIQPGHSDECCGLQEVGTCCLQSAVPLLLGMALCLIWSNANHWAFFTQIYDPQSVFLLQMRMASNIVIIVFFLLACALVFLPVRDLHRRLEKYKKTQEFRFTKAIEEELLLMGEALASGDSIVIKTALDRMNLVKSSDATSLKLATWPFDRSSLVKYGVTPVLSLAASFGKDALKILGLS